MSRTGKGVRGWHGVAINGDIGTCWLCQRPVAARTLRCESCGALQPLHDLNHFALLGLEQRFDLDLADLDRHYASARRTIDPERLATKTPKVGAAAAHYAELMAVAYDTLKNPVSRARYLLELLEGEARVRGEPLAAVSEEDSVSELDSLATALAEATDCSTVDPLAARIVHEIEVRIHTLATAFRAGRIGEARLALAHLNRLETLAAGARQRRLELGQAPRP